MKFTKQISSLGLLIPLVWNLLGTTCGGYTAPSPAGTFLDAVRIARRMESNGQLRSLPIPQERRANTVGQFAIWMMQADITKKKEDQISKQTIANDLLAAAGVDR